MTKRLADETPVGGIALLWADVTAIDDARTVANAMIRDAGWIILSVDEASQVTIEHFDTPGQEFFHRAEAQGVFMVMYTWAGEQPANPVQP